MKHTTLLMMAAGLGSRYGGNKQVDGVGPHGEILMQYAIYDALQAGFDKLVFVIQPEHRQIVEKFCKGIRGAEIVFVYQDFSSLPAFYHLPKERSKPFGTVHAVLCAAEAIHEPFAVINADDFYGSHAFAVMHDRLLTLAEGEGTMVAYYLKNTLSQNGGVTRGICDVKDGLLTKVTETYHIVAKDDGIICSEQGDILNGDDMVSMNMWGFMPTVFAPMRVGFEKFLHTVAADDLKAEYALPGMVDSMISDGSLSVHVLSTDSQWFGVTYREDRPAVVARLKEMCDRGNYPDPLFGTM